VTSYQPNASVIKGEETGAGQTEALAKYKVYRKMLAEYFDKSEKDAATLVENLRRRSSSALSRSRARCGC